MVSLSSWFRYLKLKADYSVSVTAKPYEGGKILYTEANLDAALKNMFLRQMTYLYRNRDRGDEMAPTIGAPRGTVLVRKLPAGDPKYVFPGDVVVLRDPMKLHRHLIRRLVATEGYEMVSKNEKEKPFVLEKNQCWVLCDNENLNPKETKDSRNFGPVPMTNIVGRVIYSMRTTENHGPVQNSCSSMRDDSVVLEIELDVDAMKEMHLF